jgi:hypothetical protein
MNSRNKRIETESNESRQISKEDQHLTVLAVFHCAGMTGHRAGINQSIVYAGAESLYHGFICQ